MSTYSELFVCETCGHTERHNITAYGDYDGPDIPHALKDCSCCQGIKVANPDFYKRLVSLRKRQEYKIERAKSFAKGQFNYALTKACSLIYKMTKDKHHELGLKIEKAINKTLKTDGINKQE